jgi:uncharacterized protein
MALDPARDPSFRITHEETTSDRLVAGFSSFGLAGLTAVNFLTEQLELEETGHVTADDLPSITPFENGTPRHHTRLFSTPDVDCTVLSNELFVPQRATDSFAEAILEWTESNAVEEITVLSGVPIPHGPEEHAAFYIATEDYPRARLETHDIHPMGTGFLDGVNAELVGRGMDSELRVGVLVTPVHPQTPDVEAAIRLVEAIKQTHEFDIETTALEEFAAQIQQYYQGLEDRLEAASQAETSADRMYM